MTTEIIDKGKMRDLARTLDALLPVLAEQEERLGFMLIVFDFEAGGRTHYIGNTERQDVIALLRELLGKWSQDGSVQN